MASAPGRSRTEGAGLQSRVGAARACPAASETRGRTAGRGKGRGTRGQRSVHSKAVSGPLAATARAEALLSPWLPCPKKESVLKGLGSAAGGGGSRPARWQDDLGPHLRPHREG